tara:strand:+ start:277 stop:564 length:288 start_codon:yes stop_codon:yes gene_type:complete
MTVIRSTTIDGIQSLKVGDNTNLDSNNVIRVGTALTLGHTQGLQFHTQNLHAGGFEVNNINVSGIITATSFVKDDGTVVGGVTESKSIAYAIALG